MAESMTGAMQVISRPDAKSSGLTFYFTGRPCIRGHIASRIVANKTCYECFKAAQKRYVSNNPEARKARQDRHAAKVGKEVLRASSRKSYEKHRMARLAAAKEKRETSGGKHRAENRERNRKWRAENPSAQLAAKAKYRDLHPDAQRSYSHSRRVKTGAGMTARQLSAWAKAQDKRCFYCDGLCDSSYHIDHIVPLSKGGEHKESNLVIACAPCNLAKGASDPVEFLDRIMMQHEVWPAG